MSRTSGQAKVESFNFRVDPELKAAFAAATAAEDKPAGQVLREFMRGYVKFRQDSHFRSEAQRQSQLIAKLAADPASEESEIMRWMEGISDTEGWVG